MMRDKETGVEQVTQKDQNVDLAEVKVVPNDNKGAIPNKDELPIEKELKEEMLHWTPEKLLKERQEASLTFRRAHLDEPKFRSWLKGDDIPLLDIAPKLKNYDIFTKGHEIYENELLPELSARNQLTYGIMLSQVGIFIIMTLLGVIPLKEAQRLGGLGLIFLLYANYQKLLIWCCSNSSQLRWTPSTFSKIAWYELLSPVAKYSNILFRIAGMSQDNIWAFVSAALGSCVYFSMLSNSTGDEVFVYCALAASLCTLVVAVWASCCRDDGGDFWVRGKLEDRVEAFHTYWQFVFGLYVNDVANVVTDEDRTHFTGPHTLFAIQSFFGKDIFSESNSDNEAFKSAMGKADERATTFLRAVAVEKQFGYEALPEDQQLPLDEDNAAPAPKAPSAPRSPAQVPPRPGADAPSPSAPQVAKPPARPRPPAPPARKGVPPPPKRMAPRPPTRN